MKRNNRLMQNDVKQILRGFIKTLSKIKHSQWIKWGRNLKQQLTDNDFDKQQFIVDIQQYWVQYDKLDDKVKNMYDGYQYKIYKQKIQPFINQMVEIQSTKTRNTVVHFIALLTRLFANKSQVLKFQGRYFVQIQLQNDRLLWEISQNQLRLFTQLKITSVMAMKTKNINNIKVLDSLNLYKVMQQNNQNLQRLIIPSSGVITRFM